MPHRDRSPPFRVPDLQIRPREGGYARGQEGVEQILRAALSLLIEHGYRAISFRRIAALCGMTVGNVTYYFPSKEELVRVLLDAVITPYEESFTAIVHEPGTSAERRLEELCELILEDIRSKKTTRLFPELWALSSHDPFVYDRMHDLYRRARVSLNQIIGEVNPQLPADEREVLALFMSASMEGMTVFAGHEKPWVERMPWITRITCRSFVHLVQTIQPGDISGRRPASAARAPTARRVRRAKRP